MHTHFVWWLAPWLTQKCILNGLGGFRPSLNFKEQGLLLYSCAPGTWGCAYRERPNSHCPCCIPPSPATSPEWRNTRLQHFLGGVDFLLQSSPPSPAPRNLLSLYFLTHVSDVQGCDCKQCHRPCQSCLLLPCSLPSTPGVPVTGRKANKAKQ